MTIAEGIQILEYWRKSRPESRCWSFQSPQDWQNIPLFHVRLMDDDKVLLKRASTPTAIFAALPASVRNLKDVTK